MATLKRVTRVLLERVVTKSADVNTLAVQKTAGPNVHER